MKLINHQMSLLISNQVDPTCSDDVNKSIFKINPIIVTIIIMFINFTSGDNLSNSSIGDEDISNDQLVQMSNSKSNIWNLSYCFDSRAFNTFTIISKANLKYGFSLFGVIDFHSSQNQYKERFDLNRYFLEYRLSYKINKKLAFGINYIGMDLEYDDFSGMNNNVYRIGLTYKLYIKIFYDTNWIQLRLFPIESDLSGAQLSVPFFLKLSNKIFFNGFIDYSINKSSKNSTIAEPQLNIRIKENLIFNIEYRYNDYELRNPDLIGSGVAIGIELNL